MNFVQLLAENRNQSVDVSQAEFRFQRFPHPKFLNDNFISAIEQQLPFVIMLCFLYFGQQAAKGNGRKCYGKLLKILSPLNFVSFLNFVSLFSSPENETKLSRRVFQFSESEIIKYSKDETFEHETKFVKLQVNPSRRTSV